MEDYLSIEETRRVLGVSRFTLYRWRNKGGMPFVQTGIRFGRPTFGIRPERLRIWAKANRVPIKVEPAAARAAS